MQRRAPAGARKAALREGARARRGRRMGAKRFTLPHTPRARRARESVIRNGGVSGRAARRYWKPAGPCSLSVPPTIFDSMAITSTPTWSPSMAKRGKSISKRQSELLGNWPVRFVEDVIKDHPELEQRLTSETTVIGHGPSSTPSTPSSPIDSRKKRGRKKQ
jgi:hypothetical protein